MMSHRRGWTWPRTVGFAGATLILVGLSGCGGGEADAPAQTRARPITQPAAPPPPPRPTVVPVSDLMAELRIDERIFLAEEAAPATTEDRTAVLTFFDAFARGDADDLREMMSLIDQSELEALVESGVWERTVEGIAEIALETGLSPSGDKCVLAIFEIAGEKEEFRYEPQMWYYHSGPSGYQFDAVASPPGIMTMLYGDDFIARWHEILEEELALADKPDEIFEKPKVVVDEDEGSSSSSAGRKTPGGRSPSAPGRRPPPPRRRPPGPPGR